MTYSIYEGAWTDWAIGRWKGATLTLSQRDGALLLAFVATFVALVSIRLWRITSFAAHQIHATHEAHDGLHFQRQHTLRNTTSPAAAAKVFLLQLWYWRKGKHAALRTLPWAAFALLYIGVFAVLAVFSSKVSNGASTTRLVQPKDCGVWDIEDGVSISDITRITVEKTAYDVVNAAGYARSCYSNDSTSLGCNTAPVPMLESDSNHVKCPFGDDICYEGKAFEVTTKSIDSRTHLGINARSEDRVVYDRHLTCAPLVTQGYGQYVNDTDGRPSSVHYFYGPQPSLSDTSSLNYTYEYLLLRFNALMLYEVNIWEHRRDGTTLWIPINALSRNGSDTFIIFLEQNNVLHWKPNNDPVFAANKPSPNDPTKFRADRLVSPIACFQRHRYCTPDKRFCTPWGGRHDMFETIVESAAGFNPAQLATAARISLAARKTSIYEVINSQSSKCLRAQDKMDWLFQMPLPDNQWEHEVLAWVQEGLASLQAAVQEYAAGPTISIAGSKLQQVWLDKVPENYTATDRAVDQTWRSMCHNQIIHDTQGTLNFSILGITVVFSLGFLICILSFVIEPMTAWIQRRFDVGAARAIAWTRDDNLQTLRLLFDSHRRGAWTGSADLVPVTHSADEVFFYPGESAYGSVEERYQSLPNKEDNHTVRLP
ncbi:hypothetical protein BKA66DRAFT_423820 [Pyrenochaeta sp. MPI-SDFR-AT-0127]|nr:hypothetical protein BKA66DRAFT_423820 [Pyrenochaeta sp. MPI-SDFR-AT-0127]